MNRQNFLDERYEGKFPISANTFDFMQSQTEFVSQIAAAFGNNVILKKPTDNQYGLIVIEGELLPLRKSTALTGYYTIFEESKDITAKGTEYEGARIERYAEKTPSQGSKSIAESYFVDLTGGSYTRPTTLANHFLPKGAIIMWSGSMTNIPVGFELCHGNGGVAINGVTIPDLRGRFVVCEYAGDDGYFNVVGSYGGSKTHTLTIDEMPSHTHTTVPISRGETPIVPFVGATGNGNPDKAKDSKDTKEAGRNYCRDSRLLAPTGGDQPFTHLPPYYVLAFLIKVI